MWHTLRRIAEELEPLHGVGVQGNNGIVVIGSLVNHKAVGRLLPLEDRRQVVFPRLAAPEHKESFRINSNFNV